MPPGDPRSMSLDASYHKEQDYIWFMGGDLNGLCDIRLWYQVFYEMKGVGHALTGTLWNPFAKLHIHVYHTLNFKTISPMVFENLSGQSLGRFWHAPEEPLSPPFWSLNPLKLSWTTSYSYLSKPKYFRPIIPVVTENLCDKIWAERKKEKSRRRGKKK